MTETESQLKLPPTNIVRVVDATRTYHAGGNPVTALQDLSLEVPQGVFAAIKGRSGSGKTTLLNLIGGLDQPTTGEVYLDEQPLSQLSRSQLTKLRRERLGFVFQSYAIISTLSAVENVELMLRITGERRERRERAMRSLEIVGLGPWADHRPWELSGGQQQRVAIARALVSRPDLIIADEPTGELDSVTGRRIMTLFRFIVAREGITVIMATHDPLVEEYADIVYEIDDGHMVAVYQPNREN